MLHLALQVHRFEFTVNLAISNWHLLILGELIMEQATLNGPVLVRGFIKGLSRGSHGFHIHTKGQLGNKCKDAGSHFNPFKARLFLHLYFTMKFSLLCIRKRFLTSQHIQIPCENAAIENQIKNAPSENISSLSPCSWTICQWIWKVYFYLKSH